MAETGDVEIKGSKLALAALAFGLIFVADRRAEPENVRAHVAGEEHARLCPEERDLCKTHL